MTNGESPKKRSKWVELTIAAAFAFIVSYGQRKMGSVTFDDAITKLTEDARRTLRQLTGTEEYEEPLPADFLRDLYNETR